MCRQVDKFTNPPAPSSWSVHLYTTVQATPHRIVVVTLPHQTERAAAVVTNTKRHTVDSNGWCGSPSVITQTKQTNPSNVGHRAAHAQHGLEAFVGVAHRTPPFTFFTPTPPPER